MNTKETHQCSAHVYSGQRFDFSGHKCYVNATVERDGKWWCKRHDPVNVVAKAEAARVAREETAARLADVDMRMDDLAERFRHQTGIELGKHMRDTVFGYKGNRRIGYTLTEEQLIELLAHIESLVDQMDGG